MTLLAQADALRIPLASESVDLVFGSPPYADARLYLENGVNLGISRGCREWVEWMLGVTTECLRVSRGGVVWVAAGVTRDRTYWPACEGLMWEWWKRGGSAYRPCYWHRVGIPGSGGDQWFRADVEYVMCFKRPGPLLWSDNTAMGHTPKWAPGGEMSYRLGDGQRRNQWGGNEKSGGCRTKSGKIQSGVRPSHVLTTKSHTKRMNGRNHETGSDMEEQHYVPPVKANPGTLVQTKVGGGHLGHALAHENEAPFPEALAEHFIRSLCPPGGTVFDPFSGSGTTVSVAERFGRKGIGFDLRRSQAMIARRRIERPHAPVVKQSKAASEYLPLFAEPAS